MTPGRATARHGPVGRRDPGRRPPVPILMYHEISPASETGSRLAVSPGAFAGATRVPARRRLPDGDRGPPRGGPGRRLPAACRTGPWCSRSTTASRISTAAPCRCWTGTATPPRCSSPPAGCRTPGRDAAGRCPGRMLSWSQIAEAAGAGMEVGAHSWRPSPARPAARGRAPAGAVRQQGAAGGPARPPGARAGLPVRVLQRPGPAGRQGSGSPLRLRGQQHPAGPGADLLALPRLTVRRSTTLQVFEQISRGSNVAQLYRRDRALTKGYVPWPAGPGRDWPGWPVTNRTIAAGGGAPADRPGVPPPGPASCSGLRRQLTDPLSRNGYALVANSGATGLLGLLYWVLVARLYPTAVVGRASAAYAAMNLLAGFTALNFNGALTRFIPQAGHRTRRLVTQAYAGQRAGIGAGGRPLPARQSAGGARRMRSWAAPSPERSSSAAWSPGPSSPCRTAS